MGRPVKGLMSTFEASLRQLVLDYKTERPRWGPITIQTELRLSTLYSGLPSVSTLGRLFRSQHMTLKREPNRSLPLKAPCKAQAAHDVWQIDDMGAEFYEGLGHVGLLNAKDVFSRVHVSCSLALYKSSRGHPTTKDYVRMLRLGFCAHGLPRAIQADHASVFHEGISKSPFPTPLHLWLCGLGIQFCHPRTYRPTDQAVVERTHQTMHNQLQRRTPYANLDALQQEADHRRQRLNEHIPCATFGAPPLMQYPEAKTSERLYHPKKEAKHFDTTRIHHFLCQGEWFRLASKERTFSLGGYIYFLAKAKKGMQLRINFCSKTLQLTCYNDKELVGQVPIKGITYPELDQYF